MLRLAAKSLGGNVLRLALTALAVVLGVSFVAGTFVLTDSIDSAFDDLFAEANAGIDVYVNPVTEVDFGGGGPPGIDQSGGATLDEALLDDVLAVDGVADAVGLVEGIAPLVSPDGERIGGAGPPTLGFSWAGEDGPITLREGEPPTGPDDVVIDVTTFEEQGFALGDTVTVLLAAGPTEFTIVGASGFGEEDNLLGATTASFTLERAQEVFDKEGRFDQIAIAAAEGVDTRELTEAVGDVVAVDGEIEVVSVDEQIAEQTAELDEGLAFLDVVLLSFAGVSLFVGAFLIVNTFSIVVAQRMREFALLRAVGASAAQLRRMVLVEAGIVGLVGGTLGLLGGIGLSEALRAIFGAVGADFPDGGLVLRPRTFIASYVLSLLVTIGAALLPALRAARVAPVEALRGTGAADSERIGRPRTVVGVLLGVAGTVALLVGLFLDTPEPAALVGGGVAGLFVGVALLAPWIAPPVVEFLGGIFGSTVRGRLARRNASRNPTRTSTTASALMIGVALVSFISILAASITASIGALFEEQFQADLVLSGQGGFGTLPRSLADEVAEIDGVASVAASRLTIAQTEDGADVFVNGAPADVVDEHIDYGVDPSVYADLADPGTVVVAEGVAVRDGLAAGDTIRLDFPAQRDVALEVVGIATDDEVLDGGYLVDLATYEEVVGGGSDSSVSVVYEPEVDRDAVRDRVEEVAGAYPGTDVQDRNELLLSVQERVNGLLNIMIGLLGLALVIAVIGIVNTLALSVLERTREIGLLRAVGMVRGQVRSIVYREAMLVAVFGALLGVVLGAFFGWALVTALADEGIDILVFPVGRLVVYVALSALAGVGAALLPARRAARLDVLDAIFDE